MTTCRQPFSYYFETFQGFSKFSFHHKRNDGHLLLTNMLSRVVSQLTKSLKTLGNQEISAKGLNSIE